MGIVFDKKGLLHVKCGWYFRPEDLNGGRQGWHGESELFKSELTGERSTRQVLLFAILVGVCVPAGRLGSDERVWLSRRRQQSYRVHHGAGGSCGPGDVQGQGLDEKAWPIHVPSFLVRHKVQAPEGKRGQLRGAILHVPAAGEPGPPDGVLRELLDLVPWRCARKTSGPHLFCVLVFTMVCVIRLRRVHGRQGRIPVLAVRHKEQEQEREASAWAAGFPVAQEAPRRASAASSARRACVPVEDRRLNSAASRGQKMRPPLSALNPLPSTAPAPNSGI